MYTVIGTTLNVAIIIIAQVASVLLRPFFLLFLLLLWCNTKDFPERQQILPKTSLVNFAVILPGSRRRYNIIPR